MTSTLLVMLLLTQGDAGAMEQGEARTGDGGASISVDEGVHSWARLELTGLTLRPRAQAGSLAVFAQVAPSFILDGGDDWGFDVGAPLRLRVASGAAGTERGGGLLRAEDWDSLSDFGQVVRALRLGQDTSPVALWVGALEDYSLLNGHLVRRYSNRANPDYHPAGAYLTGTLGPAYAELFGSDVLGARLLGGEVALDLVHLVAGRPREPGRYTLSLSAVHDFGRAGGRSAPVTLAHADLNSVFIFQEDFQVHAVAGGGARPERPGAWGAVVGLGLEQRSPTLELGGRLEARMQRGGFRQGFFGPDYELARFTAAGPSPVPAAEAPFPDGYSAFGELVVGWDSIDRDAAERNLELSVAAEVFTWGRVDADARVSTYLAQRRLGLAFSAIATAVGQPGARYTFSAEVRCRFARHFYGLAQGGTLFFPQPGSSLRPGAFASLGLGADYVR